MNPRPVLFRASSVRAIVEGRKTQTRRKVAPRFPDSVSILEAEEIAAEEHAAWSERIAPLSPWGKPGDRLFVSETWGRSPLQAGFRGSLVYLADGPMPGVLWHAGAHMRSTEARVTLLLTGVRRQRLCAIDEADAQAEGYAAITKDQGRTVKWGVPAPDGLPAAPGEDGWPWDQWQPTARDAFLKHWDRVNGRRRFGVAQNPMVTVLEFERVTP